MIVIGDIHGLPKTLEALMKKCPDDPDGFCFVGDLIDRGPDSRAVVEIVKEGGHHCVRGNHEDMALDHLRREHKSRLYPQGCWLWNGGEQGRASYGPADEGLDEHLDWFETLPLHLDFPDIGLFVSHSGVRPYGPLTSYDISRYATTLALTEEDINESVLWYRGKPARLEDRFHIFGHTPAKKPIITDYYANIDTGGVYNRKDFKFLTALQYPSMDIIQQENIDGELSD